MLHKIIALCLLSLPVLGQDNFYGDWESGEVTGSGHKNWKQLQAVAPDRITVISEGARQGRKAARFEVRSGDNPLDFCCHKTERAEVLGIQDKNDNDVYENVDSGTQRYSFSVKFDESWQTIVDNGDGAWGIFLQLHGPDGPNATNPALAFSATDKIRLNMRTGDIPTSEVVEHELADGSLNKGKWIDFMLIIKFAKDNSGFVKLQRRNEGESKFTPVLDVEGIPTLQYDSNVDNGAIGKHYWKHGLYRNQQKFTSVLYLDGLKRESCQKPDCSDLEH